MTTPQNLFNMCPEFCFYCTVQWGIGPYELHALTHTLSLYVGFLLTAQSLHFFCSKQKWNTRFVGFFLSFSCVLFHPIDVWMCVNGWMRVPWALQTLTLDQTLHQLHSECCFIMSHFCCGRLHCRVHYDSKCVCSHTQYNRKIQQTWLKMGKHQEEKC